MMDQTNKVRLFIKETISLFANISLSPAQAKYLFKVMRLNVGQFLLVIDGTTGEYLAQIIEMGNKTGKIKICTKTKDLLPPLDLWLLFSPLKKVRTDFVIEKATELGVSRIIPFISTRTNSKNFRINRFQNIMIEALEQCGGTYLPEIEEPRKLNKLLSEWPKERSLLFCDEKLVESPTSNPMDKFSAKPCAGILIGPEGGFSDEEGVLIRNKKAATSVCLGRNVLRAETAAISAISIWKGLNQKK